jgi:hypothetical protein
VAAGGPKPPPQQGARTANLVFYESHPSIYHSYVWALAPGCTAPPLKEFKAMTVLTNYPISTDILRRTPFCVALEEVQESGSPPILLGVRCMLVPAGQLLDLQGGNPAPLLSVKIDPGSGFDDCKPGSTEVVLSLDPQLLALDEAIKLLGGVTIGGEKLSTGSGFLSVPLSSDELKHRIKSNADVVLVNPRLEVTDYAFVPNGSSHEERLELHLHRAGVDLADVKFFFTDDIGSVDECVPVLHIAAGRVRSVKLAADRDLPMTSTLPDDGIRYYWVKKDPSLGGPVIGFDEDKGALDIVMKKDTDCAVDDTKKTVTAEELHNKKVTRLVRLTAPWLFVVASPSPALRRDGLLTELDNLDTWTAIFDGINGGSGQAPVPVAPDHRIIESSPIGHSRQTNNGARYKPQKRD